MCSRAKEYGRATETELNELLKGSSSGKQSGETVSGPRANRLAAWSTGHGGQSKDRR